MTVTVSGLHQRYNTEDEREECVSDARVYFLVLSRIAYAPRLHRAHLHHRYYYMHLGNFLVVSKSASQLHLGGLVRVWNWLPQENDAYHLLCSRTTQWLVFTVNEVRYWNPNYLKWITNYFSWIAFARIKTLSVNLLTMGWRIILNLNYHTIYHSYWTRKDCTRIHEYGITTFKQCIHWITSLTAQQYGRRTKWW